MGVEAHKPPRHGGLHLLDAESSAVLRQSASADRGHRLQFANWFWLEICDPISDLLVRHSPHGTRFVLHENNTARAAFVPSGTSIRPVQSR